MNRRIALLLVFSPLVLLVASCASEETGKEADTQIRVIENKRITKKGRIFDKINVVDIPLSASENNLKGKVHTVKYSSFNLALKNGKIEKNADDNGVNVYDRFGNLTDQEAFDALGFSKWKCEYKYDKNQRLIKWVLDFPVRKAKDTTYFYYDKNGNKIKSVTKTGNFAEQMVKEYKYDEKGNEVESKEYTRDKRIHSFKKYKYDKFGNQISIADLFPDGTPYITRKATFDDFGNMISLSSFLGDSLTSKIILTNNVEGKHIETKAYNSLDKYLGSATYMYDSLGNILQHFSYTSDGKVKLNARNTVFEYSYDEKGNVTMAKSYKMVKAKPIPQSYTEYEYTYY